MSETFIQISIIFGGIVMLTFLQRYHFRILYYLIGKYHRVLKWCVYFIIRVGVIIHEVCHLIIGVLTGAKVKRIEFFSTLGGRVTFETKNYIGHLSQYSGHPGYMFRLFLNQIGIFLTSIGPLIFGIILTYIFVYTLDINIFSQEYSTLLSSLSFFDYLILLLYTIIIPSFILSFQDIKNFIISTQDTIGATIVGSFINTIIFMCFLGFLTFFFEYFVFFGIFYCLTFSVLVIFWSINYLYFNIIKKVSSNN